MKTQVRAGGGGGGGGGGDEAGLSLGSSLSRARSSALRAAPSSSEGGEAYASTNVSDSMADGGAQCRPWERERRRPGRSQC